MTQALKLAVCPHDTATRALERLPRPVDYCNFPSSQSQMRKPSGGSKVNHLLLHPESGLDPGEVLGILLNMGEDERGQALLKALGLGRWKPPVLPEGAA